MNSQLPTCNSLLIVVGPTSSGKSELAAKLAKRFNGEIISCDSRQIYKGMNLGTGKVEGKWLPSFFRGHKKMTGRVFVYKSIPHYLIDFASPKRQYSVARFKDQAQKTIADISRRGKLPILCGGTGHWIDAVVFDQNIPDVKPNPNLRAKLGKKSADELYSRLKKLDPRRAATIDPHNPRRLIRALEIVISTGKPVPALSVIPSATEGSLNRLLSINQNLRDSPSAALLGMTSYKTLWIGVNSPQPLLFAKIKKRLKQRLKLGMLHEIKTLHAQGISWKRLESFGLEYKFVSLYLQKKIDKTQMFNQLLLAIQQYSRRQITWWQRNKKILWIAKQSDAPKIVKAFL